MLDWCKIWLNSSAIELDSWFFICVVNLLFVLSDQDTNEWLTLEKIRSELLDLESDQYYKVFHSRLIECLFLDCDVLLGKSIPVYHGLKVWAQDLTEDVVVVLPYHDGFFLLTGGLIVAFPIFTFFNVLIRNSRCEPRCRVRLLFPSSILLYEWMLLSRRQYRRCFRCGRMVVRWEERWRCCSEWFRLNFSLCLRT